MRKLLLGATAALAAFAVPAAPAEARHAGVETAVTIHFANHDRWRGDRMRWREHGVWRGDRWRGHDPWRWRRHPGWRWRSHPGFGWGATWRNPCRSLWWDGWGWRCGW